jgi:hypothetical protein
MKTLAGVVIVGVIVLLGGVWLNNKAEAPVVETSTETGENAQNPNETTMGMYAEENALVPQDQKPGNSVTINNVLLAEPGYAVIHEASGEAPGAIIGNSALLAAGEHNRIEIMLDGGTRDGETLYVMLHGEQGGNQTFESAVDMPVGSVLGGPIMAYFMIDNTAEPIVDVLP